VTSEISYAVIKCHGKVYEEAVADDSNKNILAWIYNLDEASNDKFN